MSKICLREITEGQTGWFCNDCDKRILGVSENLFGKPFIDKCPHCGAVFTNYEFCKSRIDSNNQLISEFPELARGFSKGGKL